MAFLLSNAAAKAAEERKKKQQQTQPKDGVFALTNAASEAAAARQARRAETAAQPAATQTTKQTGTLGKSGSILGVPFNAPEKTIPGTKIPISSKRGEALTPVINDVQQAKAYFEEVRQNPSKYAKAESADEIKRQAKEAQAYLKNAGQYINAISGMKSDTQYEDYLRNVAKVQSWQGLDKNEDYEQQSQYAQKYVPGTEEQNTYLGKNGAYGYYSRTGSEDIIYDYVNRRYMSAEDAARVDEIVAMNDMAYGQTHGGWNELPEDVVKTFDYLYATRGQKEAYDYLNSVQSQGMTAEGALAWGLVQGVGAPSIAALAGGAYGAISGDETAQQNNRDMFNELAQLYGEAKEEYPGITGAGQTAGNLMLMSLIGQGVGAIGSAAAGAGETAAVGSKAALTATNIARQTASNALTWVISDAVHNAGALSTGNMSGESFARSLGVSAAAGAAGSITQGLVETGLASLLMKNGLMTPFAEFVRQTTAGTASAGAYVGTSYALSENKPTNDELATQLATAFAFALIGGISRSIATTEADAAAFEQATDAIAERYRQLSENLNSLPPEERARAAQEIITETQALRQSLNSRYIAGQQENVNTMNAALNIIKQVMNGYIEGYAYAQNAAAPQTALPGGAESMAMTTRPAPSSADPTAALAVQDTISQTLQTAVADGISQGLTMPQTNMSVPQAAPAPVAPTAALPIEAPAAVQTPAVPDIYNEQPALTIDPVEALRPMAKSLGKSGGEALVSNYDESNPSTMADYARDFMALYNARTEGREIPATPALTSNQIKAAIVAADNDKPTAQTLQPAAEQSTIEAATTAAPVTEHKQAQYEALQAANVQSDDFDVITAPEQILTFQEAVQAAQGQKGQADFDMEDAQAALDKGEITVYSAGPIGTGSFVTPSRMIAENMAEGQRISSMTVPLDSVAWTDYAGGQYAPIETEDMNNGGQKGNNGISTRSNGILSQRTGEPGGAVSERTEGAGGERGAGSQTDRAEQKVSGAAAQTQRVDAKELLVEAAPGQTVEIQTEPDKNTRNAFALAKKNGITAKSFKGEIKITTKDGTIRAYYNPRTGEIGFQSDNPYVAGEDLARHEIMEQFLATGRVRISDIVTKAANILGLNGMNLLNQAVNVYYDTWAKNKELTAAESRELREHAASELVCDGADHINQLRPAVDAGNTEYAENADLLDTVLDALNQAANEVTDNAFVLDDGAAQTAKENAVPDKGGEHGLGETRFSSKITPSQKRILDLDIAWDSDENSSIKEQLLQHIDEVKNMEPATSVNYDRKTSAPYYKVLDDILKERFGYKISREDGISFLFDSKAIKSIRQYIESDAEAAAAIAAPYVVKRGKIISGHKHHKGGLYPSITIAAPAALNNNTGITAVTILFADKDRVHSLRVLTPDGKEFELQKNEADPKTSGDLAKARQTISDESASKKTIPQPGESVKTEFSSQLIDPEALEEQNEQLRKDLDAAIKEADKAKKQAAYWQAQTKPSFAPSPDATDINRFARYLIDSNMTDLKAKDIAPALTELAEYIMRGGNERDELTFTGVKEQALDIAHTILSNYKELIDSNAVRQYKDIRKQIRDWGTIQVPGNDLPPDFKDWKARNRWLRVAVSTGTDIDMVYKDLSQSWPWLFPPDVNYGSDQLYAIAEGVRAAEPAYWNPNDEVMAEATEYLANTIIDGLVNGYVEDGAVETPIRQAKTYADKMEKKLADQKYDAAQKLEEQQEKSQAQLDALRAEKNARIQQERERARYDMAYAVHQARVHADEQLANLKAHYAEMKQNERQRKAESSQRTRLLKIAKRLADKKLPTPSRALVNEYIGQLDLVAKSMTGKTKEQLQALSEMYNDALENNPDFVRDEAIEKKLARLNSVKIADLTIEQVQDLTDILLALEHQFNNAQRELDSADKRDVYTKGVQIISDVTGGRTVKAPLMETLDNLFIRNTLSPLRELRRQTGYVDDDPLYDAGRRLNEGQRTANDYVMRSSKPFNEWVQDKKLMDSLTGKDAKTIKVRGAGMDGNPVEVEITPDMRISLYLHNKNLQNQRHIGSISGGIKVPDMKLYRQGKIAEAYSKGTRIRLQPSEVSAICANMTAQERALAEKIYKYFNQVSREALADVHERLKGYPMRFVEDYFPIDTDGNFTRANAENITFDGSLEGSGWLKERVVNAKNPIMLYDATSVLLKSIQAHGQFVGLAIPIRDFNKLYSMAGPKYDESGERVGSMSVKETIRSLWGTGATDYIDKLLGDLQKTHTESNSWTDLFRKIRSNYAGATLALNLSVAAKQAGSYPTAAAVLGWKPLARAMADFGKVDLDYIASMTPLQWLRSQGYSTPELGDLKAKGKQLPKALNWIQGMDLATTRKLWKACEYYMQYEHADMRPGSPEYKATISELYNRVIEETQPNYTVMQRPQLLRSNNELIRDVSMFKTQLFQNFNILYDAIGNAAAKHQQYQANPTDDTRAKYEAAKKDAGRAISSQIVQAVVIAAVTLGWNALRGKLKRYKDEDKDKITAASFAKRFGLDVASGFAGMIPFGSEIFSALSSKLTGEKWYGFEGVTTGALTDFFSTLMTAVDQIGKSLEASKSGSTAQIQKQVLAWENIAENVAKIFGVPASNVMNLIKGMYTNITKTAVGKYYGEYLGMLATVPIEGNKGQYYDLLYEAQENNPEAFWQIYNSLVELDAMASEKKTTAENINAALKQRAKKKK